MLSWFLKLTISERCAATAIVDDVSFVEFYLDVVRQESDARSDGVHALFSQEKINDTYLKSRLKSRNYSLVWRDDIESLPKPSELEHEANNEIDNEEFDDPFSSVAIQSASLSSNPLYMSDIHVRTRGIASDAISANVALGLNGGLLRDTVNLVCATALRNAASKLNRSELSTNHHISDNLHRYLVVGSSDSLHNDSMFLLSGALLDGGQFLSILRTLSNKSIFTSILPQRSSHARNSSMRYSNAAQLSDWLPQWALGSMPVPSYVLLVARIEIAVMAAFLASKPQCDISSDIVWDPEMTLFESNSIALGSSQQPQTHQLNQTTSSGALSSSPLFCLPSVSVILNIICTSEELKMLWRKMNESTRKSILGN